MAAPVGVVSSSVRSRPTTGIPPSSSQTAGDGFGSSPWALRMTPLPVATALEATTSMPSSSSAEAEPTMSTIESWPPTSWKWTCPGALRWRRPSAVARAEKAPSARSRTRSGSRASSITAVTCVNVRMTPSPRAHDGAGGGEPVAHARFEVEAPTADRETLEQAHEPGYVRPGVDEGAERHVAGDAGEAAVEPRRPPAHALRDRSVLATAEAAP